MRRARVVSLVAVIVLAAACDSGNPVAPPTNGNPPPTNGVTVTVTASPDRVAAGSKSTLTITTANAPDGTEVSISTSLGSFTETGDAVRTATRRITAGKATIDLFAGAELGVANVLAQIGNIVGRATVTVVTKPLADFTFVVNGMSVTFTDASTGSPSEYLWDFGDGATSTQKSPLHSYNVSGTYTVKLTVSAAGDSDTRSKFVAVNAPPRVTAEFTTEVAGFSAQFTDRSTGDPTFWQWDFGDDMKAFARNPLHTYDRAGTFSVTLTVSNSTSSANVAHFVTVPNVAAPVADFKFEVSGKNVIFTDASTGTPTEWSWNFGDCDARPDCTSTQQNPVHTYTSARTYEVTLTVRNVAGESLKKQFVVLAQAPVPEFSFLVNGLAVNFVDESTNSPTTWRWQFGDGRQSNVQHPKNTYAVAGTYNVTLTATNDAGSAQITKLVTTGQPPEAGFDYSISERTVTFTDLSKNSPTSWTWGFGDGSSSRQQHPSHTYAAGGTYTVVLVVSNSAGNDRVELDITVP